MRCGWGDGPAPGEHPLGARSTIRANFFGVGIWVSDSAVANLGTAATGEAPQVLASGALLDPLRGRWALLLSELSRALEGWNAAQGRAGVGLPRRRLGVRGRKSLVGSQRRTHFRGVHQLFLQRVMSVQVGVGGVGTSADRATTRGLPLAGTSSVLA